MAKESLLELSSRDPMAAASMATLLHGLANQQNLSSLSPTALGPLQELWARGSNQDMFRHLAHDGDFMQRILELARKPQVMQVLREHPAFSELPQVLVPPPPAEPAAAQGPAAWSKRIWAIKAGALAASRVLRTSTAATRKSANVRGCWWSAATLPSRRATSKRLPRSFRTHTRCSKRLTALSPLLRTRPRRSRLPCNGRQHSCANPPQLLLRLLRAGERRRGQGTAQGRRWVVLQAAAGRRAAWHTSGHTPALRLLHKHHPHIRHRLWAPGQWVGGCRWTTRTTASCS